jgi:hypothetical protein
MSTRNSPAANPPPEIIEKVLHYLPPSSAYQWMLVCKSWSFYAATLYYKEITLTTNLIDELTRYVHRNKNSKGYCKQLLSENGQFVERLKIYEENEDFLPLIDPRKFLLGLVPYLPKLKIIDISSSFDNKLSCMRNLPMDANSKYLQHI